MEKRLFVIKNDTHYLNAKNYINQKKEAENYIFLTIRRFKGYKGFKNKIENDPDFHFLGVNFLDNTIPGLGYFIVIKTILKVKKLATRINFFDEIIFTSYNSWIQNYILNQFNTTRKVLLSDGTRTFMVAEKRKHDKSVDLKSVPFRNSKFVIEKLLGIYPIESLNFYSPVNLKVAEGDSVEVFNFRFSASSLVEGKKVYFIGSPLVEIGYVTLEKHLFYLNVIKRNFSTSEIFYFAHRREDTKNLEKYKFFGKIIKNEIPFENKMESEIALPGIIMSFFSSVIMNLPAVYPQVQFFFFPIEIKDLIPNTRFMNEYDTLLKGFKRIDEPNLQEFIPNKAGAGKNPI